MHRLILAVALALAVLGLTAPVAPSSEAQQTSSPTPTRAPASVTPLPTRSTAAPLVLPSSRAGLKGVVGHWWYVERYGAPLLDEYVKLGATSVRLPIDWIQLERVEGQVQF